MKEPAISLMARILEAEKQSAFKEGAAIGYTTALRIVRRWSQNHKLKEPNDLATLAQWTEDDLKELLTKTCDQVSEMALVDLKASIY